MSPVFLRNYHNILISGSSPRASGIAVLMCKRGMFFFRRVRDRNDLSRRPALVLTSNNQRRRKESNPWLDIVEEDRGYALYHGDNRHPNRPPPEARGNREFLKIVHQYADPDRRELAPPVLLFKQAVVGGRTRGFRQFSGFGVPTSVRVQSQASEKGHFANLAIELALLSADAEDGAFDWSWIDARRDPSLSAAEANLLAPEAWRLWVQGGEAVLDKLRRSVLRSPIVPVASQRELTAEDLKVLSEVHAYYRTRRHQFEAVASLVTQRVLGQGCQRGWVTRRSGDGGIDFVSRLDVGDGFSRVALVVLGQAKVQSPETGAVSANDMARIAARLRRGWIGAFVTTGAFSEPAQAELSSDGYPLVLVNGQRLALELRKETAETGLELQGLFEREAEWYRSNMSSFPAEDILSDRRAGHEIWSLGPASASSI